VRLGSDEITFHVTSDDSDGALIAAEVHIPPGGGPPAMHRHPPEELYRGVAGELAIYLEEGDEVRRITVTPGVVVHIPGGRPHNVRNESAEEARAFVVFTPGTEIERFFRAAAATPPQEIPALAARHGVEFTGPLP
jgi:oxalate decarboxylase/phosphoglucose isomerase-like protein (cupin superfamily)